MKITQAKLIKGTFLLVSFSNGTAEVNESYPHTEAPPKLMKAFMSLNHHLCDLTEQYDVTGQGDYDNIAARGYSIKGEGEKEGITITGVRTLKSGRSITLNSPFISLEDDSSYPKISALRECIGRCRDEIQVFMENNKSPDDIQGRLEFTSDENFVVKSEATAAMRGQTSEDLPPETKSVVDAIVAEQIQNELDEEMPLTQEMIQRNNARKNNRKRKNEA